MYQLCVSRMYKRYHLCVCRTYKWNAMARQGVLVNMTSKEMTDLSISCRLD